MEMEKCNTRSNIGEKIFSRFVQFQKLDRHSFLTISEIKQIMEKFMLLFRGSDVYRPGQPPEALQALKQKMIHWIGDLSKKGVHVASEPLQPAGKHVSGAKKTVTDTPFGDVKEIIGGCTIVQAKDINEAVEIAKGCPILESSANIEVRPIQKMEM